MKNLFFLLRLALLSLMAGLLQPIAAQAKPLHVVLIPGDQAMQAAIAAVKLVQKEEGVQQVSFQLLSHALITAKETQSIDRADVLLVRNMGRELSLQLTPVIQALKARGVASYAIGRTFEEVDGKAGLINDPVLRAYQEASGTANWANLLRLTLNRHAGLKLAVVAPKTHPSAGLWEPASSQIFERFEDYEKQYRATRPQAASRHWVGLIVNRGQVTGGSEDSVRAITLALEQRGFNVAVAYGYPSEVPVEKFLLDAQGQPRVKAVVALAMKFGNVPDKIDPVLKRLNVPLINAITPYKHTRQSWEDPPVGLDLAERSWQISGPEFAGIDAPTVVATKERRKDADTGLEYIAEVPVPERVTRLVDRISNLVALRETKAADKRVAIIYYNSPPGKENIGASYLNVLPRSLWQMIQRLEAEGYDTVGRPATEDALFERLREHGVNIGSWAPGALEKLVKGGNAALLPVAEYRQWFDKLPKKLRDPMLQAWGEPEDFGLMVWRDPRGVKNFVFPAQRFGKLLFAPEPARGDGDVKKQFHDPALPPHHQYLAFYLWLQKGFKANAMVHVGTHASYEWLPGKEVGFTEADPGEVMVGAVPQVYPYSVDVVGEGLQAKRRGMATLISHMTPPFDKTGLNPDLVALKGLVDDYAVALQKSESAALATLGDINTKALKMGVLKDLGKTEFKDTADLESLTDYLDDLDKAQSPLGLHTFGVSPPEPARQSTARAIVDTQGVMSAAERDKRVATLAQLLQISGPAELDAFVAALSGRYVSASPGGDPLRNPASLPTGRNMYGFDPTRLPTPGVYAQGSALAAALVRDYSKKHGKAPDRLLFNLWSVETMRHEGVMESQILALLGVKPVWDSNNKVVDLEVIPRAQLGRARVDVIITPSGLYRDSLPTLMLLLDKAVTLVKGQPEADNVIRINTTQTQKTLEEKGVAPELAKRMAAVRLFTEPPGAYGTGVSNMTMNSNNWRNESEIGDVYFKRVGHLFGQGFWGDAPTGPDTGGADGTALAGEVFKMALKDVKAVLHSRSSNLFGTLDNMDLYQYLGGSALAVRQVNGASPETMLVNLADPSRQRTESLDAYMGREMRSRYLNPVWINAMMKEGYSGARMVMQVTQNLWGWQVTTPEVVDAAKWQEMYETYVKDKHNLDIKQKFRDAKNMLAYQAMVDQMLVAVNKGYWKADPSTVAALEAANMEAIKEAGVACHAASCSSEKITKLAQEQDRQAQREAKSGFGLDALGAMVATLMPPAQAMPQPPAPPAPPPPDVVRGQEMREVKKEQRTEQLIWTYAWLIGLVVLGGMGYQAWRTRRESQLFSKP